MALPELISAVRAGDKDLADTISNKRTGPALVRAESGIGITERSLRRRTYDRVRAVSLATGRAQTVAALSLGAALVVALGLALWLLRSIAQPVRFLSGGNQQKLSLMRSFLRGELRVILAEEPTLVREQERALRMMQDAGRNDILAGARARLDLYRQGRPYRE